MGKKLSFQFYTKTLNSESLLIFTAQVDAADGQN